MATSRACSCFGRAPGSVLLPSVRTRTTVSDVVSSQQNRLARPRAVPLRGIAVAVSLVLTLALAQASQAASPQPRSATWTHAGRSTSLGSAPWGNATDGARGVRTVFGDAGVSAQLHGDARLDLIADDIVGTTDMMVALEDDPVEWASFIGADSTDVLGFVIFQPPPSPLYHAILLAPALDQTFVDWLSSGTPAGNEQMFAEAAMSLIHESYHWKLLSGDESSVNACALRDFGYYIAKDFAVPATITQMTTQQVAKRITKRIAVTKLVVKKKRVKLNGRWVTRKVRQHVKRYVLKTTTVHVPRSVQTTVANPLYDTLVADAQAFYNSQPPPYNAGSCPAPVPVGEAPPPAPTYHVNACWVQYSGGSWSNVNQAAAASTFSGSDILTRGPSNFWGVVSLDQPPTSTFSGTTVSLIRPDGVTFSTQPLSEAWTATLNQWSVELGWLWTDNTLFFQHPETTGSGTWTIRWSFPDREVCNSPFTVS